MLTGSVMLGDNPGIWDVLSLLRTRCVRRKVDPENLDPSFVICVILLLAVDYSRY